jgi:hypothetical protein
MVSHRRPQDGRAGPNDADPNYIGGKKFPGQTRRDLARYLIANLVIQGKGFQLGMREPIEAALDQLPGRRVDDRDGSRSCISRRLSS